MRAVRARHKRMSGLAVGLVGLTLAVSGCGGGGSSKTAAAAPAGSSSGPHAAASIPVAARTHVVAKGGGDFCKLVASAANKSAIAGNSTEEIKKHIAEVRGDEQQAVSQAPDSLKSDVSLLFGASDRVYAALARANYDYSKLNQSDLKALQEPAVTQAEARLTAYITNVCKITP